MSTAEVEKSVAAARSVEFVEDGMVVGLGTGSTAAFIIKLLAERIRTGLKIRGIPTSRASAALARSLNIPLTSFDEVEYTDVTLDGADEIGPGLELIKGGGGALLHEKIVAASSKRLIIVVDESKIVPHLGRFPLPVEVIPFAAHPAGRELKAMGCNPILRRLPTGTPYVTDEGNYIWDCHLGRIADAPELARSIKSLTGVVEHGLFIGLASLAVVAGPAGARLITA